MSRFSDPADLHGCTPSARRPERILKVRARLAGEHGIGQREHVEAAVVRDELEHLGLVDLAARGRQREAFDLLVRGEQVALDALRERLGRGGRELEPLPRSALLNPTRQLVAVDRPDLDEHAVLVDGLHPTSSVRPRSRASRRWRRCTSVSGSSRSHKLGDRARACIAGLRRREADLDDLARREQRQVVGAARAARPSGSCGRPYAARGS